MCKHMCAHTCELNECIWEDMALGGVKGDERVKGVVPVQELGGVKGDERVKGVVPFLNEPDLSIIYYSFIIIFHCMVCTCLSCS